MARNRQLTAQRILDAAQQLLAEEGFSGWGVNEIARRAGADKVLLYRYFESLDGLLDAVIQATCFWPDPETLPNQSPEAFIDATFAALDAHPEARSLLANPAFHGPISSVRRKFSADFDRWLAGFRRHTTGSIPTDDLERLPALIQFQVVSGIQNLSSHDLWKQVSPPLQWITEANQGAEWEELPPELL